MDEKEQVTSEEINLNPETNEELSKGKEEGEE